MSYFLVGITVLALLLDPEAVLVFGVVGIVVAALALFLEVIYRRNDRRRL
jgi:Flp pilus assembly protein protease CpaA